MLNKEKESLALTSIEIHLPEILTQVLVGLAKNSTRRRIDLLQDMFKSIEVDLLQDMFKSTEELLLAHQLEPLKPPITKGLLFTCLHLTAFHLGLL